MQQVENGAGVDGSGSAAAQVPTSVGVLVASRFCKLIDYAAVHDP